MREKLITILATVSMFTLVGCGGGGSGGGKPDDSIPVEQPHIKITDGGTANENYSFNNINGETSKKFALLEASNRHYKNYTTIKAVEHKMDGTNKLEIDEDVYNGKTKEFQNVPAGSSMYVWHENDWKLIENKDIYKISPDGKSLIISKLLKSNNSEILDRTLTIKAFDLNGSNPEIDFGIRTIKLSFEANSNAKRYEITTRQQGKYYSIRDYKSVTYKNNGTDFENHYKCGATTGEPIAEGYNMPDLYLKGKDIVLTKLKKDGGCEEVETVGSYELKPKTSNNPKMVIFKFKDPNTMRKYGLAGDGWETIYIIDDDDKMYKGRRTLTNPFMQHQFNETVVTKMKDKLAGEFDKITLTNELKYQKDGKNCTSQSIIGGILLYFTAASGEISTDVSILNDGKLDSASDKKIYILKNENNSTALNTKINRPTIIVEDVAQVTSNSIDLSKITVHLDPTSTCN